MNSPGTPGSPADSVFSLRSTPTSSSPPHRRLLIIYCGGTMGMKWTQDHGYVPVSGYLYSILSSLPYFNSPHHVITPQPDHQLLTGPLHIPATPSGPAIEYRILEHQNLLDSSNMTMEDWRQIAAELECWYEQFDGFVIIHGTDTMAYTAAALSFMLEGLGKPVVLTGSQIPFSELRSDATDNLLGAMLMAAHFPCIHEVVVYFGHCLFRGNRVSKVSNDSLLAFDSLNYPALGEAGVKIRLHQDLLLPERSAGTTLLVHPHLDPNVAVVRVFPGMSFEAFSAMLAPPIRGIVLVTFGSGNMPNNRPDLMSALERAIKDRGVIAVNVSQCVKGMVPPTALYATGRHLDRIGVVSGSDMTVECALAKLSFLLSLPTVHPDQLKRQLGRSLRGELTEKWRESLVNELSRAVEQSDVGRLRTAVESCEEAGEEMARMRLWGVHGFTLLHLAAYLRFTEGVEIVARAAPILTQIRDASGRLYSDLLC